MEGQAHRAVSLVVRVCPTQSPSAASFEWVLAVSTHQIPLKGRTCSLLKESTKMRADLEGGFQKVSPKEFAVTLKGAGFGWVLSVLRYW